MILLQLRALKSVFTQRMSDFIPFHITELSAQEQMASDEQLLTSELKRSVLSVYQWKEAAITGGRGTSEEQLQKLGEEKGISNISKRRTGGGIVCHQAQRGLTYALAIPRLTLSEIGSIHHFYQTLHEKIQVLLENHGVACSLAENGKSTPADPCFTHPVPADILSKSGRKIAGAGVWVNKKGFLVQGEIQPEEPVDWDLSQLDFASSWLE